MAQLSVPYMLIRGGSSKGLYFLAQDLPRDEAERNQVILDAVGRDERQIDGLGGADPLTSKAAVVSRSKRPGADIDFLFVQVVVGKNRVDTTPNCGNILAGVGPFSIETGLVAPESPTTEISVYILNSGKYCNLLVRTSNNTVQYQGDTEIDGVPGSAAPIVCNYRDIAGSSCGSLYPTGNIVDLIDGVEVSCVDAGMPVVIIRAEDLGLSGYESPNELDIDSELKSRLNSVRLQAGPQMNLGDVSQKAVPKMSLISPARNGGLINSRTFIPHKCHVAVGVLGAVSIAVTCLTRGSVAEKMNIEKSRDRDIYSVEHPSGELSVVLDADTTGNIPVIKKAGVIRTARLLACGKVFVFGHQTTKRSIRSEGNLVEEAPTN